MGQDKLSQILYNIASSEYDIFGVIDANKNSFKILHDKKKQINLHDFTSYSTIYDHIQNLIVSDLQAGIFHDTFHIDVLKSISSGQDEAPVTIYIQFKLKTHPLTEWFAITRYNVSSIYGSKGFFIFLARPATIEKEMNLENDAMRTVLNSHFEYMMGGSIEADAVKYFSNSFTDSPLSSITEPTYTGFLKQMLLNIHPESVEEFTHQTLPENMKEHLQENQHIDFFIKYLKQEKYHWYHIFIYRFLDHLNSDTHFLFTVYDETAQKENDLRHCDELHWALSQAENAYKMQTEFISNISQEIRTPLNGIQAMVSLLLQEKEITSDTVRKYASIIQDSGNHLLHIVNATLDFANLSSDTFVYTEDEYNVSVLLKNLQKFIDGKNINNIKLSFEVAEMLPSTFFGDEVHLEQAIINVIDNAFKYTPSGEVSININWESECPGEGTMLIDVADTGIGILPEHAGDVFQVFKKANHKEHMGYDGIGMGLSITKLILEHMGGTISFDSTPGVGTTFHIVVPQTVLNDQPFGTLLENEEDLYNNEQNFIAGKQFLVVDDSQMNLEVMQVVLDELGAVSTLCQSAKDAIALLEKGNHYDAIFMDHFMPDMDGIEATHYIRGMNSEYCRKIPIIAFTANAVNNAKEMYQREGMNDLLLKPLDIKKIKKILKKWL